MYGKTFESMYDGSMIGTGLNVYGVWNYVIAKTRRGVIELNPKLLAFILGGDQAEIESAIEFLCSPDTKSRSKEEEGRRLVKEGEYQYRVVNWKLYDGIKSESDRREYNRVKQAEYRAKNDADISEMGPEEAKACKKEYRKRRKRTIHQAACDGAQQAIHDGFKEADDANQTPST